jgi:pyruvate formate lyase activating enzyme
MTPGEGVVTDPAKCTLCGDCVKACPTGAMEFSGREYSVDELMKQILSETLVMDKSGGGVTFSGGEPMLSSDELLELLVRCGRESIHRAVDTTLFAAPETVRRVAEHTDLFLVDLKQMDSAKHKRFCGVPNERILENLRMLAAEGKDIIIRIPLIEGVNADRENIEASADFLASLPGGGVKEVDLLPYHDIGKGKHRKLGTVYNPEGIPMSTPDAEAISEATRIFESRGIRVKIGG